jgi:hypothetical protein
MLTWIFKVLEVVIEKTPVLGKLKIAIEQNYPLNQLTPSQLIAPMWLNKLCEFLDEKFTGGAYDKPYSSKQLEDWLRGYPQAFIVITQKKIFSWPLNADKIVATVKVLPLRDDLISSKPFEPYNIKGNDLVDDENKAKAIWVGDLVSTNHHMIFLFLALRYKLEDLQVPIYCRTEIPQLRRILFERYGAKVLNPTGADADGTTILVLDPGKLQWISGSVRDNVPERKWIANTERRPSESTS